MSVLEMSSSPSPGRRFGLPALAGFVAIAVAVVGGVVVGLNLVIAALLGLLVFAGSFATLRWRRGHGGDRIASVWVASAHVALTAIAVFGLIQLVPYGREHANPPITGEPDWSSPRTAELMANACYGCHSNEVEWPWYSNIAPISWAITDHVDEGRSKVNFSEFTTHQDEADESIETILEGSMPPRYYTAFGLHPEANLTDSEIAELVAGLRATPGFNEQDEQDEPDGVDD